MAPPTVADSHRPRRAKIVATLGPATDGHEAGLIEAGLDVARLNFSHGTHEDHARRCAAIREAAAQAGRSVAVMQDVQGPKIRVGLLAGGQPVDLRVGAPFTVTTVQIAGDASRVSTTYPDLAKDVRPGDRMLLDDGRIRLTVTAVEGNDVHTVVEAGGLLSEHKGINLPGVAISSPAITEKDRVDIAFGANVLDVDFLALSFVRTAVEVSEARKLLGTLGRTTPLVVKLEKGEAIQNLDAILDNSDAVMVARGDLGVELAPEQVPVLQKTIIRQANRRGIPVITATQMLESMVEEETPTRAEATDVANAVWDGTDALMLSAETAVGALPLLAIRMMDRIVRTAEAAPIERRTTEIPLIPGAGAAVTHAAQVLAQDLRATAIVGVTRTGRTARLLAWGRASVPVYAFSPDQRVCRQLAMVWGVTPLHRELPVGLELRSAEIGQYLLDAGIAAPGDRVVLTGVHPFGRGVETNFVKYEVLGQAMPDSDATPR